MNARENHFDFLGDTFGPERYRRGGHWYLSAKPSKKAVRRTKAKLKRVLFRSNMSPWPDIARRLSWMLRGWASYFSYGTRLMAYRAIDNLVEQRTRQFLQRRHKVSGSGTRRWPDDVIFGQLGVQRLRTLHLGPVRVPRRETSRRAGCGKTASPVR